MTFCFFCYFRIPSSTSRELTDLIVRILKRNPKERIDYEDFFNHPFLTKSKLKKIQIQIINYSHYLFQVNQCQYHQVEHKHPV